MTYKMSSSASSIMTRILAACFADIPTTWIPGLAIGAIGYVLWVAFRKTPERRKDERLRQRQRIAFWGHD